jgi:hypothetical protein
MGLIYATSRWLDRLWSEHLEMSSPARDLVEAGIQKQGEPFAGFPADLHARLYLPSDPAQVDGPSWATRLHALAVDARRHGGGTALARHLERANLLASAIGLPSGLDDGLRLGVNELVRWGATPDDMAEIADHVAAAMAATDPEPIGPRVTATRGRFDTLRFAL